MGSLMPEAGRPIITTLIPSMAEVTHSGEEHGEP